MCRLVFARPLQSPVLCVSQRDMESVGARERGRLRSPSRGGLDLPLLSGSLGSW